MRLKIDRKNKKVELDIKDPKAKEGLGWFTDDRKMECEGQAEQGKRPPSDKTIPDSCRSRRGNSR